MTPRILTLLAFVAVFALTAFTRPAADRPETTEAAAASSVSEPVAWSIDQAHSRIGFRVRHLGISRVSGEFGEYDASISFDPEDLSTLTAEVTIQVQSIDTGVERRDNHLRSPDFFTVEEYPEMRFVSKEVRNVDGAAFELVGDLTIKDVTKEVVLEGEFLGTVPNRNGAKAGFEASTTIDRFDYHLQWDRLTEAGGLVVGRDVEIILELELDQQEA